MKKKFIFTIFALCIAACAVTTVGCRQNNDSSNDSSDSGQLPALEFTQTTLEMVLGESNQLPSLSLEEGETVTYSSNNEKVATISAEGFVESKGVGSASIKATTSLGRTAFVQVVVYDPEFYPVPYISVAQDNFSFCVGDSFTLAYSYIYLGNAVEGTVVFTSNNPNVVAVEGTSLKAIGAGEALVTISGTSSIGAATRTVKITVAEKQVEFSPSFIGKEIYVGSSIALVMYANENGELKEVENASFTVLDESYALIENGELKPLLGGDTEIIVTFEYGGKSYSQQLPIHIYGTKTCSFYFADGTLDHTVEAVYGDIVSLYMDNALQNPEYNKAIKQWYINGEAFDGEEFVMPDMDVEVSAIYINETADDFTGSFSAGHLLSDTSALVTFVDKPVVDNKGVASDLNGCVQFTASFSSLCYNFDEPVIVTENAKVQIKMFVPDDVLLLYFGYASNDNWAQGNPTKRYEASAGIHATGDVPLAVIPMGEWTILELPLTAFVNNIGDKLGGISIALSNKYIYIDSISIELGLAENDPVYMDNFLSKNVNMAEPGSEEQLNAIAAYKVWANRLTEEQKANEKHQANVAKINALIQEYFKAEEESIILSNKATVEISGTTAGQPNVYFPRNNWTPEGTHVAMQSLTYDYLNFAQYNAANTAYTVTYTLPKVDFSQCSEVYFGIAAATAAGDCTINVGGASYSYDLNAGYLQMKVVIKGNVLTIIGDGANNVGQILASVELSEAILTGEEALTITWTTAGWSQVEITEIRAMALVYPKADNIIDNIPAGWGATGTRVSNFVTPYEGTHQKTFDNNNYDGVAVLPVLNFNEYDEVYFGLHAVAAAENWDPYNGVNGIITINGESFNGVDPQNLDYYFKVSVKNGVLTMVVEKANNVVSGLVVLEVELSDAVLNGEEPLTLDFIFEYWAQAEITEIHTVVVVDEVK